MMKCKKCGNEIGEGVKFCPECGSNITDMWKEIGENTISVVEEVKRCAKCGNELKMEAKFCPNCGSSVADTQGEVGENTTLIEEKSCAGGEDETKEKSNPESNITDAQEKAVENVVPVVEEVKRCAKCGNELKAEAKFCPKCGSSVEDGQEEAAENVVPVVEEVKRCAKCGSELKAEAKFCPNCGSSVEDRQEEAAENAIPVVEEVKRCAKCGNELKAEAKFCPKCGSSMLGTQERNQISGSNQEDTYTTERNKKGVFNFEKVKMIGRVRHTIIKTEVQSDGYNLAIKQNIHKFLRKDKDSTLTIALSDIRAVEVRTKMDFWDTLYAAIFGVIFILDVTDVVWLLFIALFLYAAYGKIIDLKMKNGSNFEIPVDGMTEDVESFLKLHSFDK